MRTQVTKAKYQFLSAAIAVLLLAGGLIYTYQYFEITAEEKYIIDLQHEYVHETYGYMLKELQNDLSMHTSMLLRSDTLKKALMGQDREKVYELSEPYFKLFQQDNPFLKIMTFRLPDTITFLRLHKPEMYGDSLHASRKIIIDTNTEHTVNYGFEVGKLGVTYRLATPIFYQNEYIGSLEIGIEPEYILNSLNKITQIKNALLIRPAFTLASTTLKALGKIKDFYLIRSDPIFQNSIDLIRLETPMQKLLYDGHYYTISSDLDLRNHIGETVGKILLAYDIDRQAEQTSSLKKDTFLFAFILTLLLILLLHYSFNYFISRLIRSQEELESYKERLELAFSGSNDGLWDWDMVTDGIYFSPRWKSMLGYKDDELENTLQTWKERVHPDDIQAILKDIQAHIAGKLPTFENIHRLKHKDGSWVWILDRGKVQYDKTGKAVRFIGTHTDVTKEKTLEKQVLEMNTQLELKVQQRTEEQNVLLSLFDIGSSVLFKWNNDEDWSLAHVSQSVTKLLGYDKEAFLDNSVSYTSCIHEDDRARVKEELNEAIEQNKEHFHHEPYRVITKDGELKWVYDYTILIRDNDGKVINSVGYATDITSIKERDKRLLQQSRMAQMGEMISMIAHQWRQPLGAIAAAAIDMKLKIELEKYDLDNEEERKAFQHDFNNGFDRIDGFVQDLSTTIDDFRNFFKSDKPSVQTTIERPIEKALGIIHSSFTQYHINVQKEFHSTRSLALYDSEMLQVMLNIFKNAQDHFILNKIKEPLIIITTQDTKEGVSLEIKDNGGGVPEAIIEKIFDPYFSTKDEKNGTGLGLYMSKAIVEEHHKGILSVSNNEDGACFLIEIKMQEENSVND